MQFADGKDVAWQRDALGRITQVDGPDGFRVSQTSGAYGPEKILHGNGRSDSFAYDTMGNVIKYTSPPVGEVGRRSGEGEVHYQYNLLGNLIAQNSTQYSYDPWQQLVQAGAEQWQYNLNAERAQTAALQFDKNGNMVSDGTHHYNYDALDRLQEVRGNDEKLIARYTYDALNRRISKEVAGRTTTYVYDGWEPVEIFEDGKVVQQFVRGDALDDALGMMGPYYFHKDRLGSVLGMSDASGKIIEQSNYSPFGDVILSVAKDLTGDSSASPQNDMVRRYTGQVYDAETGLYYMRNRYYSPKLGQFLTRDPIGYKNYFYAAPALNQPFNLSFHQHLGAAPRVSLPNQMAGNVIDTNIFKRHDVIHNGATVETNLHMYVRNNPLRYTDPMGLDADVVVDGNDVTIKIPITYTGPGATIETINRMNRGIQDYWSGQFGSYNVTTVVVPGSANRVTIKDHPGRDSVTGSRRGLWFASKKNDSNAFWVAAHEAGHLMGLPDRYDLNSNAVHPGYENNIMGRYDQRPSAQDITDIIKFQSRANRYNSLNAPD